jgi:DNA-binding response OmpR family regulator
MSDEVDGKKPLARVQLQKKQVAPDELADLVSSLGEDPNSESSFGDLTPEEPGREPPPRRAHDTRNPEGAQRSEARAPDGPRRIEARSAASALLHEAETKPPPAEKVTFDDELSRPLSKLPSAGYAFGAAEARESSAPAPSARRKRVLVVDDSDDIRRLLARVFRERDYDVVESATGQDALQKVREFAPDLLLLDAMLPDVHGFDVCRRLKGSRRYGHIPVIMLSAVYRGWRFAEDLRRSYGVHAFIEKPFRIGEVLAAAERAVTGVGRSQPPEEADAEGPAAEQLKAGMDAYASGDAVQAIEHLKRGLTIDPLSFGLHYHLGLLYGKQENVFEAIHELETAVDLRPRDFSTLKNLAVLYQRAGFKLNATEMWERALGSAPDDATRTSIRNHLVSLL